MNLQDRTIGIPKHIFFERELACIKDGNIKKFTEQNLDLAPSYFWEVVASSTGKYHPSYSLGHEGLARHVKSAMGIAIQLFKCEAVFNFSDYDKDCILSAIALHDICKSGTQEDYDTNKFTKHEHPLMAVKFLRQNYNNGVNCIDEDTLKVISRMIASHMGQWISNTKSDIILPKPSTEAEKFVHLADYLSSRKCLEFNFNTIL